MVKTKKKTSTIVPQSPSPYRSPPVTLRVGWQHESYFVPEVLLQSLSELPRSTSCERTIDLPDVDIDTGHVIVHFLYTGVYQTLHNCPDDEEELPSGDNEEGFEKAISAFVAAKQYGLTTLQELAKNEIKRCIDEISILQVAHSIGRNTLKSMKEDAGWLQDLVLRKADQALEKDVEIFSSDIFFSGIKNLKLANLLGQRVAKALFDVMEAVPEAVTPIAKTKLLVTASSADEFPDFDFKATKKKGKGRKAAPEDQSSPPSTSIWGAEPEPISEAVTEPAHLEKSVTGTLDPVLEVVEVTFDSVEPEDPLGSFFGSSGKKTKKGKKGKKADIAEEAPAPAPESPGEPVDASVPREPEPEPSAAAPEGAPEPPAAIEDPPVVDETPPAIVEEDPSRDGCDSLSKRKKKKGEKGAIEEIVYPPQVEEPPPPPEPAPAPPVEEDWGQVAVCTGKKKKEKKGAVVQELPSPPAKPEVVMEPEPELVVKAPPPLEEPAVDPFAGLSWVGKTKLKRERKKKAIAKAIADGEEAERRKKEEEEESGTLDPVLEVVEVTFDSVEPEDLVQEPPSPSPSPPPEPEVVLEPEPEPVVEAPPPLEEPAVDPFAGLSRVGKTKLKRERKKKAIAKAIADGEEAERRKKEEEEAERKKVEDEAAAAATAVAEAEATTVAPVELSKSKDSLGDWGAATTATKITKNRMLEPVATIEDSLVFDEPPPEAEPSMEDWGSFSEKKKNKTKKGSISWF